MPRKDCVKRLQKDLIALNKDPVPGVFALPDPDNMLQWHFAIVGPPASPYDRGIYHGALLFADDFPFSPPSIIMFTPSGRFAPGKKLCTSMSDFHPESWNPLWSVGTILSGLQSFMTEDSDAVGSMRSSAAQRTAFALDSLKFNMRDKMFSSLFIDHIPQWRQQLEERARSTGAAEVPDVQAASGASSYFAIFFTLSVASAVLYITLTRGLSLDDVLSWILGGQR